MQQGVDPCVVIVGTKNAPAPGKGMACYSVAKAAREFDLHDAYRLFSLLAQRIIRMKLLFLSLRKIYVCAHVSVYRHTRGYHEPHVQAYKHITIHKSTYTQTNICTLKPTYVHSNQHMYISALENTTFSQAHACLLRMLTRTYMSSSNSGLCPTNP